MHPLGHDRGLEQVAAVLREDDPARGGIDLVSRPADPLEPASDRCRRLDLDHEVDRTHVDPELEAGGRDDCRQAAVLERLLDGDPLLAGDRAVVGPDELLAGQLVEPLGQPLGEPPAVAEDDRRAMGADQLEDPRVDGRPDAHPRLGAGRRTAGLLVERQRLAEPAQVLDRHDDRQLERLARPRIDDRDLAARPGSSEEPGDRVEGSLRRRQPDPLERRRRGRPECLEPLEAEREVSATLRAGDRVDLVDDHVLDAAQALTGGARQEEVERFGRRDHDVRRSTGMAATLLSGGVARPEPDRDRRRRIAAPGGGQGDPGQRGAEVPLDVVRQRLERRDVEDPDRAGSLAGCRWRRVADEPVETPQERGQRLAAAGRSVDQRVPTGGDRRPAVGLGLGRRRERGREPVAHGRSERPQRIGCGLESRGARRWGGCAGGHGTPSIGRTTNFEQMIDNAEATDCQPCDNQRGASATTTGGDR